MGFYTEKMQFGMPFRIAGRTYEQSRRPACFFKIVTPGYFFTLGMRIRKGRGISDSDIKGSTPVTVVNEAFARQYFPNEDPVGKQVVIEQIVTGRRELGPEVPWQVIGVVGDEKVSGLDNTSAGVYVAYAQSLIVGVSLLAKAAGDPSLLIKSIQQAIWQINKNQALPDARDAGADQVRIRGSDPVAHVAAGRVRRTGVAAGCDRNLRRAVLRDRAAHTGARRPRGTGGLFLGSDQAGSRRRDGARRRRADPRRDRDRGHDTRVAEPALRNQPHRSSHHDNRGYRPPSRRSLGRAICLPAGPPGSIR